MNANTNTNNNNNDTRKEGNIMNANITSNQIASLISMLANTNTNNNDKTIVVPSVYGVECKTDYMRKEEKILVWNIRNAIVSGVKSDIIKAVLEWSYCAKKEIVRKDKPTFEKFVNDIQKASVNACHFTCKATDKYSPEWKVLSSGKVKATLYTLCREIETGINIATVCKTEEKPVVKEYAKKEKTTKKTVKEMTEEEYIEYCKAKFAKMHK